MEKVLAILFYFATSAVISINGAHNMTLKVDDYRPSDSSMITGIIAFSLASWPFTLPILLAVLIALYKILLLMSNRTNECCVMICDTIRNQSSERQQLSERQQSTTSPNNTNRNVVSLNPVISNNGNLQSLTSSTKNNGNLVNKKLQPSINVTGSNCCICLSPKEEPDVVALSCQHTFHRKCISIWLEVDNPVRCPYCRTRATDFEVQERCEIVILDENSPLVEEDTTT